MERRRLKDKRTAALPKNPKKKVVIINNLPQSSTTRKVLKAKGIMKPPGKSYNQCHFVGTERQLKMRIAEHKKAVSV